MVSLIAFSVLVAAAAEIAIDEEDTLEDSSFVQSQVVMGSGVRRVVPLQDDEDVEDDDESALDEDTPSLMQAGICTGKSKSKLQPVNEEGLDDEMSMLQEHL